jgi:undecaprenyl-phosphate 4-deoxy-4-formamido-L-arabinose transferase
MNKQTLVSVVIPVFNEEKNLEELIGRCLKTCWEMGGAFEIIFVDDGSTDGSAKKITTAAKKNNGNILGVILNRNYGQHAAIIAGFEASCGDIVVTLDADLQNPPEEIPKLVQKIREGFDVVGSVRVSRCDTLFRRLASNVINRSARKATGVIMHDYGCMLRGYRRYVIEAILKCNERRTFIPILANSFAKNTTEIEVRHDKRCNGESKYGLWALINLQFDLLTSMTTFPLRLLSMLGGVFAIAGLGLGVLLFLMRWVYGAAWAAQGVFTLFAVLFFLIGALFIGLGLLGEYIGRIYQDVRARPRYFVHAVVGKKTEGTL